MSHIALPGGGFPTKQIKIQTPHLSMVLNLPVPTNESQLQLDNITMLLANILLILSQDQSERHGLLTFEMTDAPVDEGTKEDPS